MLREVWRVLQPGGLFLLISGQEEGYVASFLEALPWESRTRQPVLSDKDRSAGLSQEESPLGLWTCVRAEEDPAQGSSSEGWWS